MYSSYLDESNEMEDAVFAVGGFAGHEEEWKAIGARWAFSLPPSIGYFHATDCFGGRGQFRGMSIPERVALLDGLTDLIAEWEIYLVAGVIDVPTYERFSPKHLENEFWGNKYAAAFGSPVKYTCQLQNEPGNAFPEPGGELCSFFIEESEYAPSAVRALAAMKADPILSWRGRIGDLTFGRKKGPMALSLLQLGDFGAFLAAKKAANANDGRIPWRAYYSKLLEARRIFKIEHLSARDINTLHQQHEDVKKEANES
jgi:hypothetical protein